MKRLFQNNKIITHRDSREHPRKSCKQPLFFIYKYQKVNGLAISISRGGTFIETGCQISLGEKIDIIFQGLKVHQDLRLRGWIVRLDPAGAGVSFDRRSAKERRYDLDRRRGLDRRLKNKR